MVVHGCGFCNPRSQRTRTVKKSDATAPSTGRGACFRDLASELLVAGQSHGIGIPLLRGPRSRPGAWPRPADCRTGMRWPRSIQCTAGRRIVAHGPLQFGGCHCQVARFPAALGLPTGEHAQRNGHASMCHSLQPRSTYRLGFPGDGRRLQGLVDLPCHAVTRLTQSVHLRVFHVVHFPVRAVDCHRHSNPPHRSASVAEVPGAGGESVSAATSHNRTVPSRLPLARVRPSGLKATLVTQSA